MLTYLWSQYGTVAPFHDEDFFMTDDANEIREMPEYRRALQVVREML